MDSYGTFVLLLLLIGNPYFFVQGREGLRFHHRCGHNMRISEDGKKAFRKTNRAFGHTAALTSRTLEPGEMFEIYLESAENIENPRIGVTTHSPENIAYPDYMNHLRSGTWGWNVYPNEIYQDGEIIKEIYPEEEREIKRGDTFGVRISEEGAMHFFHNGVDVGEATTGMTDKYYAYVDLYWGGSNATIFSFDELLSEK